ncbi:MAG TPA: LLM class flavin-dependent oxidoreductase [Longimicrobiales bacterium]
MKLSVLDVLPVSSGSTASHAIGHALDLARLADAHGYERIWYAEHHGMPSIASSAPEVLIGHAAGATQRVRVGAGGVMIPNHTPLQVVERYRTLNALYPDRIDLGIGRAPGTDPLTSSALRAAPGEHGASMIAELLAFERGDFEEGHPFARVGVTPDDVALPPVWLLGSSGSSATFAGQLGLGYAFAAHFSPTPARPAVDAYRAAFRASRSFPQPHVILALSVIVAEDHGVAVELSSSAQVMFARMRRGLIAPVPSPAEARAEGWTPQAGHGLYESMGRLLIAGTPPEVRQRIEAAAAEALADEVMIMTIVHDPVARLRSYELLAEAFAPAAR